MSDQSGNGVYFTPRFAGLKRGRAVKYDIDVREIAEEAVAAVNQKSGTAFAARDFYVAHLLMGWEVWGSYRSVVKVEGLSLRTVDYREHLCAPLRQYFNPARFDHLYRVGTADDAPAGYTHEGPVGYLFAAPSAGSVGLHRYWSAAGADHYYANRVYPQGAGPYVYEGRLGDMQAP